jgi:hypothetical protein
VGFFGTFVYSADAGWSDSPSGDVWLRIDIHDSDVATVDYRPSASGLGRFYLGFDPCDYFGDPAAGGPVDRDAEATAFVEWAKLAVGAAITKEAVLPLLAEAGATEPADDFVEDTARRLIRLLNLPLPQDLQDGADL